MRRRLPRILLNAATLLSLALWVVTVSLWIRGHWIAESWGAWIGDGGTQVSFKVLGCGVEFGRSRSPGWAGYERPSVRETYYRGVRVVDPLANYTPEFWSRPPSLFLFRPWSWPNLSVRRERTGAEGDETKYWWIEGHVPFWLLFVATALLPTVRVTRASRRRKRRLTGLCPTCRYDLRATPDRCPECGAVPPPPLPPPPSA